MKLLYLDAEKRQLTLYSREGRVPLMVLWYWLEAGQEHFHLQTKDSSFGGQMCLKEDRDATATWWNATGTESLTLQRGEEYFSALHTRAHDEQHVITCSLTS